MPEEPDFPDCMIGACEVTFLLHDYVSRRHNSVDWEDTKPHVICSEQLVSPGVMLYTYMAGYTVQLSGHSWTLHFR